MKCPCCEVALERIVVSEIGINVCADCSGVWFDEGTLLPFIRFVLKHQPVDAAIKVRAKLQELIEEQGDYDVFCNVCTRRMTKYIYGGDSGIVLDRCESCGGIWVDKPEIKQLAGYLKTDPTLERYYAAQAKFALAAQMFREEMGEFAEEELTSFRKPKRWRTHH